MKPEEAIKVINTILLSVNHHIEIGQTVEEINKALDMAIEALKKQRPHGEWIPCSDRLPEKQGQYYVSGGDKVWICDFLIFSNFKGGWCNDVSNPVVTAWMPLPEPYEKEGEAE